MEEGALQVETVTIDAVLEGRPASFIKMDVEGAELRALHGAAATIRNHRPALAVCVYHKPEDLVTIPRFIKKLHPDYRLYIRGHSTLVTNELVLYAV